MMIVTMTQEDLEKLLKESEQISRDWDAYARFRQTRDVLMRHTMQRLMADPGSHN